MKMMKMALLAGATVAVSGAAAHADELQDLKAQVEALNAKVAAMEVAPAVPQGYKLLAVSKGEQMQIPGLDESARDRFTEGNRATIISVMPTADAPAGTTIAWSGYVRAGLVYTGNDLKTDLKGYDRSNASAPWTLNTGTEKPLRTEKTDKQTDDWDVKTRAQLKVDAKTDTAVGEVGVSLKMRANANGNGTSDVYMETAWGYWAMTPELTLGGGYSGSLGNIGYGYDGACTCYYTDNADVDLNPGDTTQMRLSYASGPFSMGVALEDGSTNNENSNGSKAYNTNQLGAAGEIKYSGDSFSGEISGVYRGTDDEKYVDSNIDGLWQVGAGVGFSLGDMASLSIGAAMGAGPYQTVNDQGDITNNIPIYNQWWGVSGLGSAKLSDAIHAEVGAGYKHREGDNFKTSYVAADAAKGVKESGGWNYGAFDYDTYAFLGGLYYTPVDQLTIGVEGEWYTKSWDFERTATAARIDATGDKRDTLSIDQDNWTIDLVSVWRF